MLRKDRVVCVVVPFLVSLQLAARYGKGYTSNFNFSAVEEIFDDVLCVDR